MIQILTNNPYRILGVYSNSPKKDVLSNIGKMKAFLKVGKPVSFPLDLSALLSPINRTEANVTAAQSAVELPMDQIKYSLFWFMKVTPLDDIAFNHLLAGNISQAKEIWAKKDVVSSLVNLLVCALIESDTNSVALNADKLFNQYGSEYCSTVNETVKISPSQLIELFVDVLNEDGTLDINRISNVPGTSAEWQRVVGSGLVKPLIDEITAAISVAKQAKGPAANYTAGVQLMNSTKAALAKLKSLLGTTDMQYQMIADKLANAILQCGINYFNDTEEDNAPDKAMQLQSYALSIAVGQMAKDRCKENVDVLKSIGPEYKVQKEMARIANNIKRFKLKSSNSRSSSMDAFQVRISALDNSYDMLLDNSVKEFINGCQSDLARIKQVLGSTQLYLNISSAVASAAINYLVEKVNKAQNQITSSYVGFSEISKLSLIVSKAETDMILIGKLDMNADCRSYYNKNKSALSNLSSQLHPQPARTTSSSSSSGGCYIATMVYGDYDHPQVMVLRDFRDRYLDKRDWGKKFIGFYYRHSPGWVEKLKNHKTINKAIKSILDSFIVFWKKHSHYE